MRILIVDDSRAMRMIVARTLRMAGYDEHELIEAVDGLHALEVVAQEPPDVVLCDWNMPADVRPGVAHRVAICGLANSVRLRHVGGFPGDEGRGA